MRRFHSYGPVDCEDHFCVNREDLVLRCLEQMVGNPDKGGHYFTIWAPRQAGKTWLMRQVKRRIEEQYGDRFIVGSMSMQGVILEDDSEEDPFLQWVPNLMRDTFKVKPNPPQNWGDWMDLFHKSDGLFDRPLILFIDEFDSLPPKVIDRLVSLFRDMYMKKDSYILHGLALIGVRAVLGAESLRGSPFNIQRSLHVPNFTAEEVNDLFEQYQKESSQVIEPAVVRAVYDATRGQPGLVCWFGELLTEKFNPGVDQTIHMQTWSYVYGRACRTEWNNTLLNLIKKVRNRYTAQVLELFSKSDIPFVLRSDWCAYLYLNGVIDAEDALDDKGQTVQVCRFSSPFIQQNIYDALADEFVGGRLPILALHPLDELTDVFSGSDLNLPALLQRYRDYLKRLKAKGLNPWKDQPRRTDLHLTEAVGHFHLYAWLQTAVGVQCSVSPEFPTGNGKVDLHLKCKDKIGVIEVKSFTDAAQMRKAKTQAAEYAESLQLPSVTLALFVPVDDEDVLNKISGQETINGTTVSVCAVGWE